MNKHAVILLLCLHIPAILSLSDEMKELAANLHKTCVAQTGVDEGLIVKTNQEKKLPDDETLKCYIKCLMMETGCIGEDGVLDVEAVIAVLPPEIQDESGPVIRSCKSPPAANPCETVWLAHKCFLEKRPDLYMLV